jgi:hydrogenase maturation protease
MLHAVKIDSVKMEEKQIIILGVGNLLFTDEGVGIRVAEALQDRYEFPENVRVVDGGTLGMNLLGVISDADHLIVVDAVRNSAEPGTLHRLAGDEIPKRILAKNSLHQVDLLEALTCCQALDKVPETVIVGVEPEDITTLGIELTPPVRARIDDLVEAVLKELTNLGGSYCTKKEGESCADSEFVRKI